MVRITKSDVELALVRHGVPWREARVLTLEQGLSLLRLFDRAVAP